MIGCVLCCMHTCLFAIYSYCVFNIVCTFPNRCVHIFDGNEERSDETGHGRAAGYDDLKRG